MTDAVVSAPSEAIGIMSLEEFSRRYDQEGPFEIINGEIVPKIPNVSGHSKVAKRVFRLLLPYEDQGLGEVYQETTFVLTDSRQWVKGSRIPDVMFIKANKIEQFQDTVKNADLKPFVLIPDLVVEVVSPNDSYTDINARVLRYLADGVQLIRVIDPQQKTVVVHTAGDHQHTLLSGDDLLTGGTVLPDFSVKVSELFTA